MRVATPKWLDFFAVSGTHQIPSYRFSSRAATSSLDEAWRAKPDFWWEISVWDGNSSNWTPTTDCTPEAAKRNKACQYIRDGQTYTPDRYEGWAQFGLWLLRPRVLREFRGSTTRLDNWRQCSGRL